MAKCGFGPNEAVPFFRNSTRSVLPAAWLFFFYSLSSALWVPAGYCAAIAKPIPSPACVEGNHSMSSTLLSRRNLILIVVALAVAIAAVLVLRMSSSRAPGGDFVEDRMMVASDIPTTVAAGPDNTIWFTIGFADAVGMIRDGVVKRLP